MAFCTITTDIIEQSMANGRRSKRDTLRSQLPVFEAGRATMTGDSTKMIISMAQWLIAIVL
jgi:hypothetical protein